MTTLHSISPTIRFATAPLLTTDFFDANGPELIGLVHAVWWEELIIPEHNRHTPVVAPLALWSPRSQPSDLFVVWLDDSQYIGVANAEARVSRNWTAVRNSCIPNRGIPVERPEE